MKRVLLLLVLCLPILSCSNDDPAADVTEKFVGTWKTDVESNDLYTSVSTWVIDRTGPGKVRIIDETEIVSKDGSIFPSQKSKDVLDDVAINSDGVMKIDFQVTEDRITYQTKGTGIVKGDILSVSATTTKLSDGSSDPFIIELNRIKK